MSVHNIKISVFKVVKGFKNKKPWVCSDTKDDVDGRDCVTVSLIICIKLTIVYYFPLSFCLRS